MVGGELSQLASFGAGCFWGVEEAFHHVDGVLKTVVGFGGGTVANPTYEQVCSGDTGHVEVVQVTYDPTTVTYEQLLEIFWDTHDPTQIDRQGPDVGHQYRTVIYYHTSEQQMAAERSLNLLKESGKYSDPIVTSIEAVQSFYIAEEYHQQYLHKRGLNTCGI